MYVDTASLYYPINILVKVTKGFKPKKDRILFKFVVDQYNLQSIVSSIHVNFLPHLTILQKQKSAPLKQSEVKICILRNHFFIK